MPDPLRASPCSEVAEPRRDDSHPSGLLLRHREGSLPDSLMSVTVRISSSFHRLMRGRREVVVSAEDVAGVINALDADYPGIKQSLCDDDGRLRRFNAVIVDCVDVRSLQGPATPTPPGSEVDIISAIAGG